MTSVTAASYVACITSASVRVLSASCSDIALSRISRRMRSAFLFAISACSRATDAFASAASISLSALAASAFRSAFQSSSSSSPSLTVSPSSTVRMFIWPPVPGDKFALRQAFNVPALVFATTFSTMPRDTWTTVTSISLGRILYQATPPARKMTSARLNQRKLCRGMRPPFRF